MDFNYFVRNRDPGIHKCSDEPLPFNPAAETALQPPICCSESLFSCMASSPEEFHGHRYHHRYSLLCSPEACSTEDHREIGHRGRIATRRGHLFNIVQGSSGECSQKSMRKVGAWDERAQRRDTGAVQQLHSEEEGAGGEADPVGNHR